MRFQARNFLTILKDLNNTGLHENFICFNPTPVKIILKHDSLSTKCIVFLMPNEKCPFPLESYVVSVDSIEKMTGLDFFPGLPDPTENEIEALVDTINWSFEKPRSNYGYEKDAIKCH